MDHADAFLDDIVADPRDDAVRLIYADWLLDQGGWDGRARAELIHLQFALEALPAGDVRRTPHEWRQREILQAHQEWTAELRALGVREVTFRRGFVEGIKIHPVRLMEGGEQLQRLAPLRELIVSTLDAPYDVPDWRHWDGFADLPLLGQIEALDLGKLGGCTPAEAGGLIGPGRLRRLRRLVLARSAASVLLEGKWPVPRLEALGIVGQNGILDGVFALACLEGLTRLEMSDSLPPDDVLAIARSSRLDQLEELSFTNCGADWLSVRWLAGRDFPRLRVLELKRFASKIELLLRRALPTIEVADLSGSAVGDPEWTALVRFGDRLRRLVLNGCQIGQTWLGALASSLPALESLHLRTNRLGDAGLRQFLEGGLGGLRELDVVYNGIGPMGLAALGDGWPEGLEILDLSWNPCRDAGVGALAASAKFRGLTMLDLSYCELTDAAAKALARAPGVTRLEALNLSTNAITDAGLTALAHSPHLGALRSLHLGNTDITDRGAAALIGSPLLSRLEVLMLNETAVTPSMRERLRQEYRGILG